MPLELPSHAMPSPTLDILPGDLEVVEEVRLGACLCCNELLQALPKLLLVQHVGQVQSSIGQAVRGELEAQRRAQAAGQNTRAQPGGWVGEWVGHRWAGARG